MNTFLTSKKAIVKWLDEYEMTNYTLIPNDKYEFVINVNGDVNLSCKELTHIPVKLNLVNGYLKCDNNQLTSLEFCPSQVEGSFSCYKNKLTSLEGCPSTVGSNFGCFYNQLKNLEFCPTQVGSDFFCYGNLLISLEFCPSHVGGKFNCSDNSKLKEIQNINDFNEIYRLHREYLIKQNQKNLEDKLINKPALSTKVKI